MAAQVPSNGLNIDKGLKFPATANMQSDGNTLDDYEVGYYTVSFTMGSGSVGVNTSYDQAYYKKIGDNVLKVRKSILKQKYFDSNKHNNKINVLTHCNAGWLATIDWGTATSPIYHAHQKGIKVHVWVDETRPRNQGANLTSYELNEEGVSNTIIADNTGGILMQRGQVDMCILSLIHI